MSRIKAVLFDVIGTTVVETDPTTITGSFEKAFRDHGLHVDVEAIRANRGKDKKEMIELLIPKSASAQLATAVYQSFIQNVESQLHHFKAREGAEDIFNYLREHNIKVGLGTGLSRDLFEKIREHLQWPHSLFDYIGIPENGIRSRPHPDMILDMLKKLSLSPSELLKVGDTVADIQEGKNAGVPTVAMLAGTQPDKILLNEKPNFSISHLIELKSFTESN